ncbi:20141_t:CDS:2, partial [Gigaspora rosea]
MYLSENTESTKEKTTLLTPAPMTKPNMNAQLPAMHTSENTKSTKENLALLMIALTTTKPSTKQQLPVKKMSVNMYTSKTLNASRKMTLLILAPTENPFGASFVVGVSFVTGWYFAFLRWCRTFFTSLASFFFFFAIALFSVIVHSRILVQTTNLFCLTLGAFLRSFAVGVVLFIAGVRISPF